MNNNLHQKRKARFNLFDLMVLLILIGIIFGAIYYFTSPERSGAKYVDIEYTILVKSMKASYGGKVAIGDMVIDTKELCEVGQVMAVTESQAVSSTVDRETGRIINTAIPGMISVEITLTARVQVEDDVHIINGVSVRVGEAISFRVPNLSASGHISTITIFDESSET